MTVVINGTTGITSPGGDTGAADFTINGLTVGKGGGSVASNTALGVSSLASNTGDYSTSVGYLSLQANTSGYWNTSVGAQSLYSNTTGNSNISVGTKALYLNTTGASNTAIGREALQANTTASNNTAVGYQAAYSNTTGNVTALGTQAAYSNTTGNYNIAIGEYALYGNTTGQYNTAIGSGSVAFSIRGALGFNTTGSSNTALGSYALFNNTTASNNTAVGYQAGYSQTTNANGVYIGSGAYYSATGGASVAIGYNAGYSVTSGYYNCFVGYQSGNAVTTGTRNTILGAYSGNQGGLDIRTASNYIVLSDGDGNPRGYADGSGNWNFGSRTISAASVPAGSVIQVVNASTSTQFTTTSSTFVSTGLSASITPKFSTSKILVVFSGNTFVSAATANGIAAIYRGSTNLTQSVMVYCNASGTGSVGASTSLIYLDSPATTSSTTYAIYAKRDLGTMYFSQDNNSNYGITLMEIAG